MNRSAGQRDTRPRSDAGDGPRRVSAVLRGVHPGSFAVVMATGIVSAALRQAGSLQLSRVLLAIAAASFTVLLGASAWQAALFPAEMRGDLRSPDRAFTSFAFVAACNVLGYGLAGHGLDYAAALAAAGLLAWLVLTCLVPGRLTIRSRTRPAVTDVNGSWYLWAVGTQSLVIAAAFLRAGGLVQARAAALAAVTAWSAGVVLYLAITVAVAARLLLAGLGPRDATAPYWVAMGAASITVLAAVQILHITGQPSAGASRAVMTGLAVTFWALATCLIPPLIARSTWRHLRMHAAARYRADLWMIVFPAGMYAAASMQLGAAAGLPLVHQIGAAATWAAAAAWALCFAAMITAPFRSRGSGH